MPGLVIPSSVTVPVALDGASREVEEVGDRGRAFNGTYRQTIRARKDNWRFKTAPVSTATAASIISSLNASTQPLACYGTLIGVSSSTTANFHAQLESEEWTEASSGRRSVLTFRLMAD